MSTAKSGRSVIVDIIGVVVGRGKMEKSTAMTMGLILIFCCALSALLVIDQRSPAAAVARLVMAWH